MLNEGGHEGVSIGDFSGGETDFPLAGQPNQSAKLYNFLIREDNKALIRNGSEIYDTDSKTNPASDFLTKVKPKGQTTTLLITPESKQLLIHTRESIFFQSGANWNELISAGMTHTFLPRMIPDGSATFFTDNCRATFDTFGKDTYIFPKEDDNKFAAGVTITDDEGTLSLRSFGLPKADKGLYAQTLTTMTSFFRTIETAWQTHWDNAGGHAAAYTSYSIYGVITLCEDLESAISILRDAVLLHISDARKAVISATYHYVNQTGPNSGMCSFLPDTFEKTQNLVNDFACLINLAHIFNLHVKDFFYNGIDNGAFRHTDNTSYISVPKLYAFVPQFQFASIVTPNGLYPMNESMHAVELAGVFSAVSSGGAYEAAVTIISSLSSSGYDYDLFLFACIALAYYIHASDPALTILFGQGDLAEATNIQRYYPKETDKSGVTLLAQQEDNILTNLGIAIDDYSTDFKISSLLIKQVLENTTSFSDGSWTKETSEPTLILLPAFVDTYTYHRLAALSSNAYVSNIQYPNTIQAALGDNIPAGTVKTIYRYSDNTEKFYLVASMSYSTNTSLYLIDVETGGLTGSLITRLEDEESQGLVSSGSILSCDQFFIVNNCGWAVGPVEWETNPQTLMQGFVYHKYRLRQSIQNAPTSFSPNSYYDFKDRVIGGGHILEKPIIIADKQIYRVDGLFADDGSGGLFPQAIQSTVGGNSHLGCITVNNMVYFSGSDCLYRTDGYTSGYISMNKVHSYLTLDQSKIKAFYCQDEKSIYWLMANSGKYSDIWVMNLEKPVTDVSCLTRLGGSNMLVSAAVFNDAGELIRGDKDGFVFIHRDSLLSDPRVNRTTGQLARAADNTILTDPIPFDYQTCHNNFGTAHERKYVTQYDFSIENASHELAESFTVQPYYSNDRGKLAEGISGYVPLNPIRITMSTEGIFSGKRMFSAGGLRCVYKQLGFRNGVAKITDSTTVGSTGSVVLGNSFVLNGSSVFPYSDIVGDFLYLAHDGYNHGYEIVKNSTNTLVTSDTLPAVSNQDWKISGMPKTERWAIIEVNIPTDRFSTIEQNQKDSAT